jgi:hypothetical protein
MKIRCQRCGPSEGVEGLGSALPVPKAHPIFRSRTTPTGCSRRLSALERCESGRIGFTANELTWVTGSEGSNPSLSA